jgi:hypothetical protein
VIGFPSAKFPQSPRKTRRPQERRVEICDSLSGTDLKIESRQAE